MACQASSQKGGCAITAPQVELGPSGEQGTDDHRVASAARQVQGRNAFTAEKVGRSSRIQQGPGHLQVALPACDMQGRGTLGVASQVHIGAGRHEGADYRHVAILG